MNEPAALKATFSDFRLVKTRKLAQLVFEVPIEEADRALAVLGGLPRSDMERWCGIARLNSAAPSADAGHGPVSAGTETVSNASDGAVTADAPKPDWMKHGEAIGRTIQGRDDEPKPRRHFSELPRAQQAGMLSQNPRFQAWAHNGQVGDIERTAAFIRSYCKVGSRADIDISPRAKAAFDSMYVLFLQETGQAAEPRR